MDTYRTIDDRADPYIGTEEEPAIEAPPEIGTDERRMHVRAYNYWVSLLNGRAYPSIGDVNVGGLDDFGPHSVLLDFTQSAEDPVIAHVGEAIRAECRLEGTLGRVSEVPSRSLLSRLTDHYLQIIANRAPIGFEAEFVGQHGHNTMYRGILMPLSSDGERIDFIYGVINWKVAADAATTARLLSEVTRASASAPAPQAAPVWADGPNAEDAPRKAFALPPLEVDETLEIGVAREDDDQPSLDLTVDAGLADRLCAARETAEAVKSADARSRTALYRALGEAYDFALAAEEAADDYAEILDDAGLKAQARAPMTPVVKLVFGADYDKTRLTEFAAALSYGRRRNLPAGGLGMYLERFSGGLKGVVQAERRERRPAPKPDTGAAVREALREADVLAYVDIMADGEEFVLLVARREPGGDLAIVAPVAPDQGLIERAIRKSIL
jgi:hypothetical protein